MYLIILVSLAALVACEETYTTNNDDLDVEALVGNNESLKAYFTCFVDRTPCDAIMSDFKKDLPEAVEQACAKCNPAQKHILRRFLEALKEKFPKEFEEFQQKFDSDNKYMTKLQAAIANA